MLTPGSMRSRPSLALAPLLLLLTLSPACTIYFGDDDGDDDCAWPAEAEDAFAIPLRNPENGVCESFGGGGGGGGCQDLEAPEGAPAPLPDWGQCFSECEALTETECWAAERCRAVYLADPCGTDANGDSLCESPMPVNGFMACWSIAPSGPAAERVACESLDAYECSRHNDCVANYLRDSGTDDATVFDFLSCGPEPGNQTCAAVDCGPGYHCEEQCFPCDSTDGDQCPPFCQAVCVPDQNECPILCPPNSECVEICADCVPGDPDCEGVCRWECVVVDPPLTCEDVTCAPGETCELQCWTNPDGTMGDCRPVCVPEVPPPPPPGCEGLTDEMACIAAAPACRPLYTGTCWVNPDGTWACVDTEFARCESAAP